MSSLASACHEGREKKAEGGNGRKRKQMDGKGTRRVNGQKGELAHGKGGGKRNRL
jgi:hypothetical protein